MPDEKTEEKNEKEMEKREEKSPEEKYRSRAKDSMTALSKRGVPTGMNQAARNIAAIHWVQ